MQQYKSDQYELPLWCIERLPVDFSVYKSIHAPCDKNKVIHNYFKDQGLPTTTSSYDDEFENTDLTVMMPPLSLGTDIVEKAISVSNTVISFHRIGFLASMKRRQFWIDNPRSKMIICSRRPSFYDGKTDNQGWTWFVWDKTGKFPQNDPCAWYL